MNCKIIILYKLIAKYWYNQKLLILLFLLFNIVGFILHIYNIDQILPIFLLYISNINFIFFYFSDKNLFNNNFYTIYFFPKFWIHSVKITYLFILSIIELLVIFLYFFGNKSIQLINEFSTNIKFLIFLYFIFIFVYKFKILWQKIIFLILSFILSFYLVSINKKNLILIILILLIILIGLIKNETRNII